MDLYLISPIEEGTAVTAGRQEIIANIVRFHEKCHKVHKKSTIIHQKLI